MILSSPDLEADPRGPLSFFEGAPPRDCHRAHLGLAVSGMWSRSRLLAPPLLPSARTSGPCLFP
eukprot:9117401-Pyramimonas_sp.AAC.1